jgi:hypothetical protein
MVLQYCLRHAMSSSISELKLDVDDMYIKVMCIAARSACISRPLVAQERRSPAYPRQICPIFTCLQSSVSRLAITPSVVPWRASTVALAIVPASRPDIRGHLLM